MCSPVTKFYKTILSTTGWIEWIFPSISSLSAVVRRLRMIHIYLTFQIRKNIPKVSNRKFSLASLHWRHCFACSAGGHTILLKPLVIYVYCVDFLPKKILRHTSVTSIVDSHGGSFIICKKYDPMVTRPYGIPNKLFQNALEVHVSHVNFLPHNSGNFVLRREIMFIKVVLT